MVKFSALYKFPTTPAVADPGFPVGGHQPRGGAANSRGGYVSKNLYVETKESGPLGGAHQQRPLDPPMPWKCLKNTVGKVNRILEFPKISWNCVNFGKQ